MEQTLKDLRYALRTLLQSPGFLLVAVVTLALGIGANSAIFSLVKGVLLEPLPFPEPERLVRIAHRTAEQGVVAASFSPQDFEDFEKGTAGAFASVAAWHYQPGHSGMNLTGSGGEPERVDNALVDEAFFSTLGLRPALGRWLLPAENVPGADRVAVLSDALWRRSFGADPGVVGSKVSLDGEPFTVVGVMPPSFEYPEREVDLWAPISLIGEDDIPTLRGLRWMGAVGRLRPGVSLGEAQAASTALFQRLAATYPETNEGYETAALSTLHESLVREVRPALLVLLGSVGLVQLIACANLANLLLARATARGREIAVRTALGASRGRLVRQLLTESLLLALLGGAAGLVLAAWGVDALRAVAAGQIPRPDEIRPDGWVIAFTFLLSLLTGLLFGLLPSLRASSPRLHEALKEGGRGAGEGRGRQGARGLLIVAETALAVVVLAAAGLLLRSFWLLVHVDPGFQAERVLAFSITIPDGKYPATEQKAAYRDEVLRRLGELPGVVAVGASKTMPLAGRGEPYEYTLPDRPPGESTVKPRSGAYIVTPGYFRALGIPVLRGRTFTAADGADAPPVLVINQALARQYWPGQNPVGQTLLLGEYPLEIVGVVGDVRHDGLATAPEPAIYVPATIAPRSTQKIFLRTTADPLALAEHVRRAIWELDPDQPISELAPLPQAVAGTVARPRLIALLLGTFALLAAALAAIGLYGVISYSVRRRTHEIGVRIALGAQRGAVLKLVIGQGIALAGAGLVLGLLLALATGRLLSSLLFGVSPGDPATLGGAALLLAAAALLASWLPARWAAGLDPTTALRGE